MYQMVTQLGPIFTITYPAFYKKGLRWIGMLNLDLVQMAPFECLVTYNFYSSLVRVLLSPPTQSRSTHHVPFLHPGDAHAPPHDGDRRAALREVCTEEDRQGRDRRALRYGCFLHHLLHLPVRLCEGVPRGAPRS